ncbi:uncharacterized protein LOC134271253 isoform X2 [Saccostrea cucullata]|uniref:uncharacterized protein LOC134271253 isoform X2 n=1 Tax=Saccostrea cuccullata TaxID=36930 RepID=UPI002ED153AA
MCNRGENNKCCYNNFFNGTACLECPPGYYGVNCSASCSQGSYGHLCSQTCKKCPQELCDRVLGCPNTSSTNTESTVLLTSSVDTITVRSTLKVTTEVNLEVTTGTTAVPTSTVQSSPSANIFLTKSLKTPKSSTPFVIPQFETPYNYIPVIAVTGGVIALFLAILVIQSSLKMRLKKQKITRAASRLPKIPVEEQEIYHEIDDMNIVIDKRERDYQCIEKNKKYCDESHLYTEKAHSYQVINNSSQDVEKPVIETEQGNNHSSTEESNSSEESGSSYLKPHKTTNKHSYIQVVDPDMHNVSVSSVHTDKEHENDSSSQYDDTANDSSALILSVSEGDYLDVEHCLDNNATYLEVVHQEK